MTKHLRQIFLAAFVAFTPAIPALQAVEVSYEVDGNYSVVGGADTEFRHGKSGSVSEQSSLFRAVVSPQTGFSLLRIGVEWERFSFGLLQNAPLPNTFQSASVVLGMDFLPSESWIVRIETTPGFYGDLHELGADSFDAPVVLGASYIASPDLQWVFGIRVDALSKYPVLPGLGVRWKFADKWVLNAVPPAPRLEYQLSKATTLYVGANLKGLKGRCDGQFGNSHGDSRLNNAILEYFEVRAGAGATWKMSRALTLGLEAGYLPYRKFDFYRADTSFKTRSGAPYGQLTITSRF